MISVLLMRSSRPPPQPPEPQEKRTSHVSWGPQTHVNMPQSEDDSTANPNYARGFEEREIRHKFVRLVYMILFGQLVFTVIIVAFFRYYRPICEFVNREKAFWWSCIGASFVLIIMISCCARLRHKFPINFILLFCFTLVQGTLLGGLTCYADTMAVLYAMGITVVVVVALTIFAWQTRCDFTMCSGIMLVFLVILVVMGICCIFIRNKILHLVYAGLGCLVFSVYLVIDTQLVMGGKHRYSLAPNEYILGALHLYIDIVMMFMFIYTLLQGSGD